MPRPAGSVPGGLPSSVSTELAALDASDPAAEYVAFKAR